MGHEKLENLLWSGSFEESSDGWCSLKRNDQNAIQPSKNTEKDFGQRPTEESQVNSLR